MSKKAWNKGADYDVNDRERRARLFVYVWQTSGSIQKVMDRMNMSYSSVTTMSHSFRRRGVKLKRFSAYNIDSLKRIAEKAIKETYKEEIQ